MKFTFAALIVLLGGLSSEATAQEDKTEKVHAHFYLNPVVVTSNRSEQSVFEANRGIELVNSERGSELQSFSLPELLDEMTGVYVQRTNRGAGSPIIRGLLGPQNLIVIDGVRFNTSTFRTGPNQYLSLIDPNSIRRVEVVRGPSSVLYGNGAMGGVMQILTLNPNTNELFSGHAAGRFASADLMGGGSINLSGSSGALSYLVGGTFDHHGILRTGTGIDQPASDYDVGYWRTKLGWKSGAWQVQGAYFGALMRDAGRADKLGIGELRYYDNDDHLAYMKGSYRGADLLNKVELTVSYHGLNESVRRFNCKRSNSPDGRSTVADRSLCEALDISTLKTKKNTRDTVHALGADLNFHLSFWEQRILVQAGGELYQDYVSSTQENATADSNFVFESQPRGNFSNGSTYLSSGAYFHADTLLLEKSSSLQLHLNSGGRFSYFAASAPNVPEVGNVNYSYNGFVGSIGLQLLKPKKFNLFASFVQGFRAPNLQESTVLGNTGSKFEVPNSDLRPEHSNTIEGGSKVHLGPVELSATAFYSMLKDAIDEVPAEFEGQSVRDDGSSVVKRVNTAEGLYWGIESSAALKLWRLTLRTGATWMKGDLTHGDGTTTPARRVPPLFGTVSLRYTHPDKSAYLELYSRWAGAQDRLHPSDVKDLRICETSPYSGQLLESCAGTPGYAVFGARAGWKFIKKMRADLSIHNLADTNYKIHGSGYPGPGLDARLTLSGRF